MIALSFLRFPDGAGPQAGVWVHASELADVLRRGAIDPQRLADELDQIKDTPATDRFIVQDLQPQLPLPTMEAVDAWDELGTKPIEGIDTTRVYDDQRAMVDHCKRKWGCKAELHLTDCPERGGD